MKKRIVEDIRGIKYIVERNISASQHCNTLCDAAYGKSYCAIHGCDCAQYEYMKLKDVKKKLKFGETIKFNDITLTATKGTCEDCYFQTAGLLLSPKCQLAGRYCNGKDLCLKHFKGGV